MQLVERTRFLALICLCFMLNEGVSNEEQKLKWKSKLNSRTEIAKKCEFKGRTFKKIQTELKNCAQK